MASLERANINVPLTSKISLPSGVGQDQALLDQLRDIEGLGRLNLWPPAPIWLFLGSIIALIILLLVRYGLRRLSYIKSWQYSARRELDKLESELDEENAGAKLIELSKIIKRIIISQYGRAQCASLTGIELLKWLNSFDRSGFDWVAKGGLLVERIYDTRESGIDPSDVKVLIYAVRRWVAKKDFFKKGVLKSK